MKQTRLRRQSAKARREYRERRKLIASFEGFVACRRCGAGADDLHEVLSRARGGSISDPANCVPLCRECHDWVTTHPRLATGEGWLERKEPRMGAEALVRILSIRCPTCGQSDDVKSIVPEMPGHRGGNVLTVEAARWLAETCYHSACGGEHLLFATEPVAALDAQGGA